MDEFEEDIAQFERALADSSDVERELLWELKQWETEAIKRFADIERAFRKALRPLKLDTWSGEVLSEALPNARSEVRGVVDDLRHSINDGFDSLRGEYESAIQDLRAEQEYGQNEEE